MLACLVLLPSEFWQLLHRPYLSRSTQDDILQFQSDDGWVLKSRHSPSCLNMSVLCADE